MVLRLDHVSVAVKDFDNADRFFSKLLNLVPGGYGNDNNTGFMFQVYSAGDLSRFELIAPAGDMSFLDNFLKDRAGGVHHITFQVPDIKDARDYLDKERIPYFGYNDKCENWKELFIHPSDAFGVLIQFAEFNPHEWINDSEEVRDNKKWDVRIENDRILFIISHPGGGKAETELTADDLDRLINDLIKIRDSM